MHAYMLRSSLSIFTVSEFTFETWVFLYIKRDLDLDMSEGGDTYFGPRGVLYSS